MNRTRMTYIKETFVNQDKNHNFTALQCTSVATYRILSCALEKDAVGAPSKNACSPDDCWPAAAAVVVAASAVADAAPGDRAWETAAQI